MKRAHDLSRSDLVEIVDGIQRILYMSYFGVEQEGMGTWSPDKVWDSETIEHVIAILSNHGLVPKEKEEEEPR